MTSSIYTVGGAVPQRGNAVYVERLADKELLDLCLHGSVSFILTTRQIGKSSLRIRTSAFLQKQGIIPINVDLNELGEKTPTMQQWYFGLIRLLVDEMSEIQDAEEIDLDEVKAWWQQNDDVPVIKRFIDFMRNILLKRFDQKIVFFIDEIDTTIGLDYTDDFFAAIRTLMSERDAFPQVDRLTIVLIGSALPSDLIDNPIRTPFNIGKPVVLTDFTPEEARPLSEGFGLPPAHAEEVLNWILEWTGGHPYLTQFLCSETRANIAEEGRDTLSKRDVDRIVESKLLTRGVDDHNLNWVGKQLSASNVPHRKEMLLTYNKVLRGLKVKNDEKDEIHSRLKLAGIVKVVDGRLHIRNRIYETFFNRKWVKDKLDDSGFFATTPPEILFRIAFVGSALLLLSLLASVFFLYLAATQAIRVEAVLVQTTIDRLIARSELEFGNEQHLLAMFLAKEALSLINTPGQSFDENIVALLYNRVYAPGIGTTIPLPQDEDEDDENAAGVTSVAWGTHENGNDFAVVRYDSNQLSRWDFAEERHDPFTVNNELPLLMDTPLEIAGNGSEQFIYALVSEGIVRYDPLELGSGNLLEGDVPSNIVSMDFSPMGEQLVTISSDTLSVYKPEDNSPLTWNEVVKGNPLNETQEYINVMWGSGDCIATVERDRNEGNFLLYFYKFGPDNSVSKSDEIPTYSDSIAFVSADPLKVAHASSEDRVTILTLNAETCFPETNADAEISSAGINTEVQALAWSDSERQLAVIIDNSRLRVYDILPQDVFQVSFEVSIEDIEEVVWHPSKPLLATISGLSPEVLVWETVHGAQVQFLRSPSSHDFARGVAIAESESRFVVTADGKGVEHFDRNNETIYHLSDILESDISDECQITYISARPTTDPNDTILAVGTNCSKLFILDPNSPDNTKRWMEVKLDELEDESEHAENVAIEWAAQVNSETNLQWFASVWRLSETPTVTRLYVHRPKDDSFESSLVEENDRRWTGISSGPDGRYLASSDEVNNVAIYEIDESAQKCVGLWSTPGEDLLGLAWSRRSEQDDTNRGQIAAAGAEGIIYIVDPNNIITADEDCQNSTIEDVPELDTRSARVNDVAWGYSSNQTQEDSDSETLRLFSANSNGSLSVFDLETRQLLYSITDEHIASVDYIIWHEGQFASSSSDGTVIVWRDDSLIDLQYWIEENREIDISCLERENYFGILSQCNSEGVVSPEATPLPSRTPTMEVTSTQTSETDLSSMTPVAVQTETPVSPTANSSGDDS